MEKNLKSQKHNKIDELLIECIKSPNDDIIAKLWLKITKSKIVCTHTQDYIFYKYNEEYSLYEVINFNDYTNIVKNELGDYIKLMSKTNNHFQLDNLNNRCLNYASSQKIAKTSASMLYNSTFLTKLDSNIDEFHFLNGYIDLRTGEFKKRTSECFISKCNKYNYLENDNKDVIKAMKFLNEKIKNICNDNDDIFEFSNAFFGYCLTGDVSLQTCLFSIGIKASNGKSTMAEMFSKSFSTYSYKMNRASLETGQTKIHKDLARCKGIRFCYIEELEKKINTSVFKDLVGTKTISNEIMFGTTETINLNFKLNILSNYLFNANTDKGVIRRGAMIEYTNEFLDVDDPNYKPNTKGIYLVDNHFLDRFDNDIYKNALFHIYLPHAIKFFKNGKIVCNYLKEAKNNFKDVCVENDKMKNFIEQTFEITKDESELIYKDNFTELYKQYSKLNFINWTTLLSDAKRCYLQYNSEKRIMWCGQSQRGCFIGLKLRDGNEEENPIDDGIDKTNNKVNYEMLCEKLEKHNKEISKTNLELLERIKELEKQLKKQNNPDSENNKVIVVKPKKQNNPDSENNKVIVVKPKKINKSIMNDDISEDAHTSDDLEDLFNEMIN
jgi:hypothetical protein